MITTRKTPSEIVVRLTVCCEGKCEWTENVDSMPSPWAASGFIQVISHMKLFGQYVGVREPCSYRHDLRCQDNLMKNHESYLLSNPCHL